MKHEIYYCDICANRFSDSRSVRASVSVDDGDNLSIFHEVCNVCINRISKFIKLELQKQYDKKSIQTNK